MKSINHNQINVIKTNSDKNMKCGQRFDSIQHDVQLQGLNNRPL